MVSSENMAETTQATNPESEKITDVKEIIALLAQKFPQCFSVEGDAKPLKIGIFKDLAERMEDEGVVSRTQLRQALRRYTSSWRYLKCVAKGGTRFDLDGQQGDALENDHIEHAAKALEQSKARFDKKKVVKDKKIYKKSQLDTGETPKKQAKFKGNKQRSAQAGKKNEQNTGSQGQSQTGKANQKQVDLSPLTEGLNKPGTRVLVKFGQSPVPGVIKEVTKGDIHVQLNSGMVIKTKFENVFLA